MTTARIRHRHVAAMARYVGMSGSIPLSYALLTGDSLTKIAALLLGAGLAVLYYSDSRDWRSRPRSAEARRLYRDLESWIDQNSDPKALVHSPDEGATLYRVHGDWIAPAVTRTRLGDIDLPRIDSETGVATWTTFALGVTFPKVTQITAGAPIDRDGPILEKQDKKTARRRLRAHRKADRAGYNHASVDELRDLLADLHRCKPFVAPAS